MTQQYSCRSELSSCDCLLQHGARTLATPAVAAAAGLTSSSSTPSAEGALSSSSECTDGSSPSVTHGFCSLESVVELKQTPSLRQRLFSHSPDAGAVAVSASSSSTASSKRQSARLFDWQIVMG